jgi:hypothetical protein
MYSCGAILVAFKNFNKLMLHMHRLVHTYVMYKRPMYETSLSCINLHDSFQLQSDFLYHFMEALLRSKAPWNSIKLTNEVRIKLRWILGRNREDSLVKHL